MNTVKFLFCLVAISVSFVKAEGEEDGRIVNGAKIDIKNAPYMVQLKQNGGLFCGGSLIASNYVVTAAHCVYGMNVANFRIVSGATTTMEAGTQRTVIRYKIHPEYNPKTMHTDIAVLELNAPIYTTYLQLCRQPLNVGDTVQVSGWGRVGENMAASSHLLTVQLPVRPFDVCQREFGQYVKQNMFCVSGLAAVGSCRGDSGGPAVFKGQLCGLVAFSYKCGEVGHTDAYTNVYNLRSFVTDFMSRKI